MPISGCIIQVSGPPAAVLPADQVSFLTVAGLRLPDESALVLSLDLPATGAAPFYRFKVVTNENGMPRATIERHAAGGAVTVLYQGDLLGGDDLGPPYTVKATYKPSTSKVRMVLTGTFEDAPTSIDSGDVNA